MTRTPRWIVSLAVLAGLSAGAARAQAPATGQAKTLELQNEVVCRVNTDVISKRDIEDRMGPIFWKLSEYRYQYQERGMWTEERQKEWDEEYFKHFREQLRKAIREKLILQEARLQAQDEKLQVDRAQFVKRRDMWIEGLKKDGIFGQPGYTLNELEAQLKEQMLIEQFRNSLVTMLDLPSRPQVEKYYHDNLAQYQRKAAVKIRRLKIARIVESSLGVKTVRNEAHKLAEDLRQRLAAYNEDFRELVLDFSDDDEETKKRGGLMMGADGDEFIDPESNPLLQDALRGMDTKFPSNISRVLDMEGCWVLLQLVERRAAGAMPLDGKLYQKIYDSLAERLRQDAEDDWFRKVVRRSLILRIQDGKETNIPLAFFFPDEDLPDEPSVEPGKKTEAPAGGSAKK
ncbi:MAG: peptidylprolyl isomerase [Planctomycetota bacterium]|nr:peptidylprolyl isomerase [Planctomycetota bacterium]